MDYKKKMYISVSIIFMLIFSLIIFFIVRSKQNTTLSSATTELGKSVDDPEKVKMDVLSEIKKEHGIIDEQKECPGKSPDPEGNCDTGFIQRENTNGQMCCYIDYESTYTQLTDKEMNILMAKSFITGIVVEQIVELVISQIAKRFLKEGIQETLNKSVTKIASRAATKVSKLASKMAVSMGVKVATKTAVLGTKAIVKAGMGPVGWASLAFDVISLALDIWDPGGYNDWISNNVYKSSRNRAEMMYEDAILNEGMRYPIIASYLYNKETSPSIMQDIITLPALLEYQTDLIMTLYSENFGDINVPENEPSQEEVDQWHITISPIVERQVMEEWSKGTFDKEICTEMARKGHSVKYDDTFGCSLTKAGCDKFNKYQLTLDEKDRVLGMYTNEYRVRNKEDPGDPKKPNMITRFHSNKVCMLSPLIQNKSTCEGPDAEFKNDTWNPDAGMCSFGTDHCNKFDMSKSKLKNVGNHTIYNCRIVPGTKMYEFFLGTTVTRSFIKAYRELDKVLYVTQIFDIGRKIFPIFDGISWLMKEDLLYKGAEISLKFGRDAAIKCYEFGRNTLQKVYKMTLIPGVTVGDVVYALQKGVQYVAGLLKNALMGVFNLGRDIIDTFKDIVDDIIPFDYAAIGDTLNVFGR